MSTVGVGAVAMGAAGVGVAAGALVVGAGILVARGIMWCGQKMEENYQHACQEWTGAFEAARQENLARVELLSPYLVAQVDRLSSSAYLSRTPQGAQAAPALPDHALQEAIAEARRALEQAQGTRQKQTEVEHSTLVMHLRTEIAAGRGLLPPEVLQQAEGCLSGTQDVLHRALADLEAAWDAVSEKRAQDVRQSHQLEQALTQASTRLNTIELLLRDAGAAADPAFVTRARELEARLGEARDAMDRSTLQALDLALAVQQEAGEVLEAVSAASLSAWNAVRSQITTRQGVLATLAKMLQEVREVQLVPEPQVAELEQMIAAVQQEAQVLAGGEQLQVHQRLSRLTSRVTILKERVFAIVKTHQQQTIARSIQDVLADLGFQSLEGARPEIMPSGNALRVEALVSQDPSGAQRDDRVVTFGIAHDGQVSYDFSGYEAGSCLVDAEKIFAALRERGIFILDQANMQELRKVPADALTLSTLGQERFHPHLERNKSQAVLAETLRHVLGQMYPHVHQVSVGGHIELEAFEGQLGYHVVLSPAGEVQVYRDAAHIDVSADAQDPVVAEAQRALQPEHREQKTEPRPQAAPARPSLLPHKRQQLGQ
jgi:hypothetical protein